MGNPVRLNDRRDAEFGRDILDPDDPIDRLMPVIQACFLVVQRYATKSVGFDSPLNTVTKPQSSPNHQSSSIVGLRLASSPQTVTQELGDMYEQTGGFTCLLALTFDQSENNEAREN